MSAAGPSAQVLHPVRWFLDIDGTISPYGLSEPWSGPTLYDGSPHSGLAVPYRPELVHAIQRLHESGVVEVVWLTTWDVEAASAWTKVGFGPFPITPRRKAGRDHRWWKAHAVQTWMCKHPNRRAMWTDDDITRDGLRGLDKARLLTIAPDPAIGLTDKHLGLIEAWVAERKA